MITNVKIYTEYGDFEQKDRSYDALKSKLLGNIMVYFEKTGDGLLVAAGGIVSRKSSSDNWNTFLFGKIPKSEITEADLKEWYSALLQKERNLGLHIEEGWEIHRSELSTLENFFKTEGKQRIGYDPKKVDLSRETKYLVHPDTNVPYLMSCMLKSDKVRTFGFDLSGSESRKVPGEINLRYGYAPQQPKAETMPTKQEKKTGILYRLFG